MKEKVKEEIRKVLEETREIKNNFYTLKDLKVELLDYTKNPYKTCVNMAMQTWTSVGDKWSKISPETRFEVMKSILEGKTLPLALEHPTFSFQVSHIDRSTFDQIARQRIGIVFASKGQKDDDLHDSGFIIPSCIYKDPELCQYVIDMYKNSKKLYSFLIEKGVFNWAARCVLPMYLEHNFIFSANFMAIKNMLARRLETTEQEGMVAFAWLVRERIKEVFPLLAEYLRPSCDLRKRDMTELVNGFSDVIGIPHISDNRQPGFNKDKFPKIKWNSPCTDISIIEKELNIKIPKPNEWIDYSWETLLDSDRKLFEED